MKRIDFLKDFLGALGAVDIEWKDISTNYISGKVWYDPEPNILHYDPEEDDCQDFCWHAREDELLAEDVVTLVRLLNKEKLLDVDRISISEDELRRRYSSYRQEIFDTDTFSKILDKLLKIQVPMVDEGRETDAFFMHF